MRTLAFRTRYGLVDQSLKILLEQAEREEQGEILLVGDSITERSGTHRICGQEVFNAGMSWAKLSDVAPLAPTLAKMLMPSRIFIAIGTNDGRVTGSTNVEAWTAQYIALIRSMGNAPIVLVPTPALELAKPAAAGFDQAALDALNARLTAIARETGASLISRPVVDTVEGVHPSAAGAAAWRAGMQKGVSSVNLHERIWHQSCRQRLHNLVPPR